MKATDRKDALFLEKGKKFMGSLPPNTEQAGGLTKLKIKEREQKKRDLAMSQENTFGEKPLSRRTGILLQFAFILTIIVSIVMIYQIFH